MSTHLPAAATTSEEYKEILKSNGITDEVSEVIVKEGVGGEGMASVIKCVTMIFANPKLKPLTLFVKALSSNPSHTQMVEDLKAFEKEARFFMEYVPAAKELCKKKGMEDFMDFYPKCYYGDEKLIILENLVLDKGYKLLDKLVKQDLEETICGLKTLAKHHALGHAMTMEHGGPEKFFQKFKNFDYEPLLKPFFRTMLEPIAENAVTTVIEILEEHAVKGSDRALVILKSLVGNTYQKMVDSSKTCENELLVLNHGDYWNNNMMFQKDEGSNNITGHVAIDMQGIRYNSPVMDIAYYLFTSMQHDVRRDHLRDLLNTYLTTLQKYSEDLGYPISLTSNDLFLIFRQKFQWGFLMGMVFEQHVLILKDLSVEELDVNNWGAVMKELVQKWVKNNPEKGLQMAKDAVVLMDEYAQLYQSNQTVT